jgi:hypothetical protein
VDVVRPEWNDAALRQYLLGLLPEDEAEALEDAYLADAEVWQRLRGVEEDLLDDYAAGRLALTERSAVESRYLASSPLRERLVAARALRPAIEAGTRHPTARVIVTPAAQWGVPLALAAGLILAAVLLWPWRPAPSVVSSIPSPSPAGRSEPPAPPTVEARPSVLPPTTRPARRPVVTPFVLALSPVLLRGQERPAPLIPAGTEEVILELEGDPALLPPSASEFPVVIERLEGRPVWRGAARRANRTARPSLLASTRVPTARLGAGDYLLTLYSGATEGEALHRYFFRLDR